MADYANLHFKNYIPDKDINEKILPENPVPSDLQEVPVLADFVRTLLVSQTVITTDHQMEKLQEKILQVMGSLSRLWKGLEDVRNESSEAVEVPVDKFATLVEQTTLLLGQASLSISYARRLNILKTLLKDPRKAKTLLKEKTALLQEDEGHLFGKTFRSHIIEIESSKKKYLEVFKGNNEKNTPFRKGPLLYQNRPQGGGRYCYAAKSSNRDQNKNVRFQNNASVNTRKFHHAGSASNGKYFSYNSKGSSCHQQFRTSSTNKDCNSRSCASNNTKIIYKKHSKCTISRKISLLHSNPGKNCSGSRNIIYCKGVRNPVCKSPISAKNTKLDKNVKRTIFISGTGSLEMLEKEGAIQKVVPTQGQNLSNFLVEKKGWRKSPSDKFKKSQQIHSLRGFQNGRSALPEIPSRTGGFAMQDRSQGGIFFSSPQQKLSKVCQISMFTQPIPISLPMFWTRASSKNFYKIIKSPNCPLETGQHLNHYLPKRYVANEEDVTRNSHGNRHIDFSIAIFGFCDQPQKISPAPCEANRVSGLSNRYRENDFCSF